MVKWRRERHNGRVWLLEARSKKREKRKATIRLRILYIMRRPRRNLLLGATSLRFEIRIWGRLGRVLVGASRPNRAKRNRLASP